MPKRRYLMLRRAPSVTQKLLRALGVACLAAGLTVIATAAAAEPGFDQADARQGRIHTVGAFEVNGHPITLTASGRRVYADTEMMRARVEESQELRQALPGFPQEPHVKIDVRMAF